MKKKKEKERRKALIKANKQKKEVKRKKEKEREKKIMKYNNKEILNYTKLMNEENKNKLSLIDDYIKDSKEKFGDIKNFLKIVYRDDLIPDEFGAKMSEKFYEECNKYDIDAQSILDQMEAARSSYYSDYYRFQLFDTIINDIIENLKNK